MTYPESIQHYVRLLLNKINHRSALQEEGAVYGFICDVGTVLDGTNAIHAMSRMGPQRLKHSTNDQRDMARLIPDTKYVLRGVRKGWRYFDKV